MTLSGSTSRCKPSPSFCTSSIQRRPCRPCGHNSTTFDFHLYRPQYCTLSCLRLVGRASAGSFLPDNMDSHVTMNTSNELPSLPDYQLTPLPPLMPPIPDKLLTLLLPIAAYWGLSMFFHWIDTKDYFPQHRLHTPAEVLKRNRVSRWEVVRDVLVQQIIQTAVGWLLGMTEPDDFYGKEEHDIAVWARRIRMAQRAIPWSLAFCGFDAIQLAKNLLPTHPILAGALRGQYPITPGINTTSGVKSAAVSSFIGWELTMASAIYWVLVPTIQFAVAIVIVDTWQYFLHRAMHMNRWMYSTFRAASLLSVTH